MGGVRSNRQGACHPSPSCDWLDRWRGTFHRGVGRGRGGADFYYLFILQRSLVEARSWPATEGPVCPAFGLEFSAEKSQGTPNGGSAGKVTELRPHRLHGEAGSEKVQQKGATIMLLE
ncbi:hypothetical protein Bbelb_024160 [Branchiostoma belcheri]|nr:hypothetical protein Bbelb_024160 [Branchiostoma belcheri]